jgi:hypothetical protein
MSLATAQEISTQTAIVSASKAAELTVNMFVPVPGSGAFAGAVTGEATKGDIWAGTAYVSPVLADGIYWFDQKTCLGIVGACYTPPQVPNGK